MVFCQVCAVNKKCHSAFFQHYVTFQNVRRAKNKYKEQGNDTLGNAQVKKHECKNVPYCWAGPFIIQLRYEAVGHRKIIPGSYLARGPYFGHPWFRQHIQFTC